MKNFLLFLCSDDMRPFLIIGTAFVFIILGLLVFATLFMYRACPPRETLERYPWGVKARMFLPFTKYWQSEAAPEDIEPIRKFRRGLFTWELVFFASSILRIAYFNLLGHRLFLLLASGQCRN